MEHLPHQLDALNQLWGLQGSLHREIEAPGQQQIVEGGIDKGKGAGIEAGPGRVRSMSEPGRWRLSAGSWLRPPPSLINP
jgi:hypothetical protein